MGDVVKRAIAAAALGFALPAAPMLSGTSTAASQPGSVASAGLGPSVVSLAAAQPASSAVASSEAAVSAPSGRVGASVRAVAAVRHGSPAVASARLGVSVASGRFGSSVGVVVAARPGAFGVVGSSDDQLFTFKDSRITESSGLAVSPTKDDVYYTHNDSAAGAEFFAVDGRGRTKAVYSVAGAEARDWEAMAASTDPSTGRGVLWFADIGDNFDGAWPDISVYKVMEPASLRDGTVRATRYRLRYEDGGRNAEGIMVNPKTGRLYVITKEFSGAVYAAPQRLRANRTNILRKVGSAPIMATDAAYAPDGSSFVIRTYFSATLYRGFDEQISRVSMPELEQAESITYTRDGKALLVGSEGVNSPVYQVALPERALEPSPSDSPPADGSPSDGSSSDGSSSGDKAGAEASKVAADAAVERGGLTGGDVLVWLAAAAVAIGAITLIARRTR